MSKRTFAVLLGAGLGLAAMQVPAQQSGMSHGSMGQGSAGQPGMMQMQSALADGEIRKVDKDAGKLTIKHGPIPSMDMPPMTMVYRVKEPAMLDAVKPGDKVKFDAQKMGGQYVVTRIEPAK
jgi:Cu/Ag efflux protein CusF